MKLLTNFKNPSSNHPLSLWNGDFDPENVYRNTLVVLKYHTPRTYTFTCKGSLTRDLWASSFFHISVSPGPLSVPLGQFKIFRKFAVIFANQCLSAVSMIPAIKEETFGVYVNFFHILLRAFLSALYFCRLTFCLFFIFSSRQAGIVSTVLSVVSLTPAKNLSAVSLTPENSFLAVS